MFCLNGIFTVLINVEILGFVSPLLTLMLFAYDDYNKRNIAIQYIQLFCKAG